MVMYCSVYGCFSTSRNDKDRSFFRFPKTEVRCKQWIRAVGRPDFMQKSFDNLNKGYFVCDLHFQETDRLVKKLKANAVPSQNLPHHENVNPEKSTQTYETTELVPITEDAASQTYELRTSDAKTQTTQNIISADSASKRKILSDSETDSKKQKTENQIECAPRSETNCDMSPQLQKLSDLQNRLKGISSNKLCDRDFKLFSLKLRIANPLAYSVLAKTLSLPTEDALRQIYIGTKLHQTAMECLEFKLENLTESGKYCIISLNEMLLKRSLDYDINEDKIVGFHEIDGTQTKEFATQAFVIMASGIFSDWVQPLGYCFLAQSKNYEDLHTWINETISEILNIGFRVVAFVSDHSSIFMNFANSRHVSVDKPYFSINGNKIYYIFDVPNLVTSVRNNLIKHDFEFLDNDGNQLTAKWVDIQQFYKQDCERAYRLAPKLTESHISPNTIDKFDVTYAAQVFSNTVGAAMNHLVECGRLDQFSMGTIHLIGLMNKTFDVLNSSVLHDPNNYKSAFAAQPHQTKTLDEFEQFLSNVTVVNKTNINVTHSITCLKSFAITLKSIKCLSRDMRANDFSSLFTRRLNQEALQHFFTSVRQQAKCRDPSPIQFSRAFRESFMENLLKQSKQNDCSDNLEQLLVNIDDLDSVNIYENLQHDETGQHTLTPEVGAGIVDRRFDLPSKDPFIYVCGYFLEKCFNIHKCDGIKQYVKSKEVHTHALLLINPPKSFVSCIKTMDDRIKHVFNENKDLDCIGKKVLKELSEISVSDCCSCFPNLYLKKLFATFRICNIVKVNNKLLRDKSCKQKVFGVSDDFLV